MAVFSVLAAPASQLLGSANSTPSYPFCTFCEVYPKDTSDPRVATPVSPSVALAVARLHTPASSPSQDAVQTLSPRAPPRVAWPRTPHQRPAPWPSVRQAVEQGEVPGSAGTSCPGHSYLPLPFCWACSSPTASSTFPGRSAFESPAKQQSLPCPSPPAPAGTAYCYVVSSLPV